MSRAYRDTQIMRCQRDIIALSLFVVSCQYTTKIVQHLAPPLTEIPRGSNRSEVASLETTQGRAQATEPWGRIQPGAGVEARKECRCCGLHPLESPQAGNGNGLAVDPNKQVRTQDRHSRNLAPDDWPAYETLAGDAPSRSRSVAVQRFEDQARCLLR